MFSKRSRMPETRPGHSTRKERALLWPALASMTAVQAVIAAGIFGLGIAAPLIGLPVTQLGWLNVLIFGLGACGASQAGRLCQRWGGVRVTIVCVSCVLLASLLLSLPMSFTVWPAAILLGLAFGPETAASSASLVRVTTPAQRNGVIALRQTGNQWGAIAASLCLPMLMEYNRATAFGLLALLCLVLIAALMSQLRIDQISLSDAASAGNFSHALLPTLAVQCRSPGMPALLALSASYAAIQIAINGFAFSYLVRVLELAPAIAGILLATAQGAGLLARILLGTWARHATSTARALGWIGPGIALSVTTLALMPAGRANALLYLLMFVVGFLASGWNGLLLAELSRRAGPSRTAAWTGATMTVSYAGLVTAPLLFTLGSAGMRSTYLVLAAACGLSGIAVLLNRPAQSGAKTP